MFDVVIAGATSGLLYGLLGFAVVVLFKMTGVPNFAEGSLATVGTYFAYVFAVRLHLNLATAITLGLAFSAVVGLAIYLLVMRYRDDAGPLNLTVRTLGLYLLLFAIVNDQLGQGQPFSYPNIFPVRQVKLGPVDVPAATIGILAVAVVLTALFMASFRYSRAGLLLRGMAADRETALLLGTNVRRLTAASWALTTVLAAAVGILTAPTTLLSADMMDNSLLYVFAAVIIGGLTSVGGAFVGGVTVGIVQGVVYSYSGADLALLAVFALFLGMLLLRPHGLFGERVVERF
jgi:branched-chain amino acid transport system permease protein